ncbi:MAG: metallophosphoesterase [Deltaproteobacteria bacterium]|nr:metallophosphoesterase [Deltaproteobacteria bacterium]
MSLFLTLYLILYGGMQVYLYLWLRLLLPAHPLARVALGAWLGLMLLAPALTRGLALTGHWSLAKLAALAGYHWMALSFLGFCVLVLWGGADVLVRLVAWAGGPGLPRLYARGPLLAALGVVGALYGYGLWEASHPRLETVTLTTPRLPAGSRPLVLAQISDLHLSLHEVGSRLDPTLALLEGRQPDLIISTGDFWDGLAPDQADKVAARLAALRPPLGKYAIFGNHEYYVGLDRSERFHRKCGFQVLRNQALTVGGVLNLAGVDDIPAPGPAVEAELVKSLPPGLPTVFLKHRPLPGPYLAGRVDLMLSGHTHAGQIYPFNYVVDRLFTYFQGLFHLEGGVTLYVSRGTGAWGPPVRLAAVPEVTWFVLRPKK